MTERTIRNMAKELAGSFYEQKRTLAFRQGDQLIKAHKMTRLPDGSEREEIVHVPFLVAYPNDRAYVAAWWPFFVDAAKRCFTTMLADPNTKPDIAEGIYLALIEENEKAHRQGGGKLLRQRHLDQPSGR
jgi:hypothetical protein